MNDQIIPVLLKYPIRIVCFQRVLKYAQEPQEVKQEKNSIKETYKAIVD
jgi:hypothetical protein